MKTEADDWRIVGHVLLSPVSVAPLERDVKAHPAVPRQTDNQGTKESRGLGLAPVAVLPEFQSRGYGSQLVRAALQRARVLGYGYVVVLGHADYYPRFGFGPASRFGLQYEAPVNDENFMAVELVQGALHDTSGVVRFLDAFR